MRPRGEGAKLVNYGGNIALFWEEYMILNNHRKKLIWCEEIVIEKKTSRRDLGIG